MAGVAVVLLNLGGPTDRKAIRPFLLSLFKDPAILRMPAFFRFLLAHIITLMRFRKARKIYDKMGGHSPLLEYTNEQAKVLEEVLQQQDIPAKVFVCMRYWHPMAAEVVKHVQDFEPDHIVLLPLYPQYSTTTTQSSFDDWDKHWGQLLPSTYSFDNVPTTRVGCYPTDQNFIDAFVQLALPVLKDAMPHGRPMLLLSAHGLPQSVVDAGDPYQCQVEQTAALITKALRAALGDTFDTTICYQSRVGPKKWLKPAADVMIQEYAKEKRPLVVLPVSFVSDHSETLVELDLDYKDLALTHGAPFYGRVPSLGVHPRFINGLAYQVKQALLDEKIPSCCAPKMLCACRVYKK